MKTKFKAFTEQHPGLTDDQKRIIALVDHWCPDTLKHEPFELNVIRAFMAATACCADQKRVLDGKQPIRPLDSWPDPMKYFSNTPTGLAKEQEQESEICHGDDERCTCGPCPPDRDDMFYRQDEEVACQQRYEKSKRKTIRH